MSGASPSTLTVDLGAYAHNLRHVRGRLPDSCAIAAVVKADAYGLGAAALARRALDEGVHSLAVATPAEGALLRGHFPDARILLLYQPTADQWPAVIEHGLRATLSDTGAAETLANLARKSRAIVPVHCEIDTGMGRHGFSRESAPSEILQLTRMSNIDVEGICTHFPAADIPDDPTSLAQIKTFRAILRELDRLGIPYETTHAANSAALINYPAAFYSMVRVGLITYGVWPTAQPPAESPLRPVVRWESRIIATRLLPGGASVGYGRTFRTRGPTRAATIPVGYADGYPHSLSNCGDVLIRGLRCPVIGRVSMDSIVVDITGIAEATAGDRATLIGEDGNESITVEDLARRAETIPYEILTGIGQRVERRYTG